MRKHKIRMLLGGRESFALARAAALLLGRYCNYAEIDSLMRNWEPVCVYVCVFVSR